MSLGTSCSTLSNHYSDSTKSDEFWASYSNEALAMNMQYNADYKLEPAPKKWGAVSLPRPMKRYLKKECRKGKELLVWGATYVSPYFKIGILYPGPDSEKSASIKKSSYPVQEQTNRTINDRQIKRKLYQVVSKKDTFSIYEYQINGANHPVQILFAVNHQTGFEQDDFIFPMPPLKMLQREAESLLEHYKDSSSQP